MDNPTNPSKGQSFEDVSASDFADRRGKGVERIRIDRNHAGRHVWFAVLCALPLVAFWGALSRLTVLAYRSDYYSHTIAIPFLCGYLIYRERGKIFAIIHASPQWGAALGLLAGLLFSLQKWGLPWTAPETRFSLLVLTSVLCWIAAFALCYGCRAFRAALFPLLMLLLMVPLPMAAMDDFIHLTRVGSAEVAAAIFGVVGLPVYRNGFLFVLPGVSIEIVKECSGIHSTVALSILSAVAGYVFLRSTWKRLFVLLLVFPIVSLTNGLRIATLALVANSGDRTILHSSLHRDGGILFFLIACGLIALALRCLRAAGETRKPTAGTPAQSGDAGGSSNLTVPLSHSS
jgi:exosortase